MKTHGVHGGVFYSVESNRTVAVLKILARQFCVRGKIGE